MAEKWIQTAIPKSHEGRFTAQAKKKGMSVSAFANAVLSGKVKASTQTKKRARLAKTLGKLSRKKK